MDPLFSENERERVVAAIRDAEAATGAEIVPLVVLRSGPYPAGQWRGGVAFVLATLVFVPIGLGTVHALQDLRVLVFVLGATLVYGALRLIRRNSVPHPSVVDPESSFRGGTGSSSWS